MEYLLVRFSARVRASSETDTGRGVLHALIEVVEASHETVASKLCDHYNQVHVQHVTYLGNEAPNEQV